MKKTLFAVVLVVCLVSVCAACGTGSFDITGKWQNVGSDTFGQVQSNSVIVFDGANCNFYSPKDTYTYNAEDSVLTVTGMLFSDTLEFPVTVIDSEHIQIEFGSGTLELQRVE